jgi:hypothetical protein
LQAIAREDMEKFVWGRITWFMFHIMAEKIKPEFFAIARKYLLEFVTQISYNLPCPICSEHARRNLARVDMNHIKTKEDFKYFIFAFHNKVNVDTNKPVESLDVLDKYATGNLDKIIEIFIYVHNHESYSNKLMMRKHMKNKVIKDFVGWYTTNKFMFA